MDQTGRQLRAAAAVLMACAGLVFGFPFVEFVISYVLHAAAGIDGTPAFLVPASLSEGELAWRVGAVRLTAGLGAVGLLLPWGSVAPLRHSLFWAAVATTFVCCVSGIELLAYAADFGCLFNPTPPWDCTGD